MTAFRLIESAIDTIALRAELEHPACGAIVSFDGVVRDQNDGRAVRRLEYQCYTELALQEGAAIIAAVGASLPVHRALCVHRIGVLEIGDIAVWVGVSSAHRDAAFEACRQIIDQVKLRVPIWKNEFYQDGQSGWIHPQ